MLFPYFRSLLITPAVKVDLYFKASNSDTDILIIDLEDSIPHFQKEEARSLLLNNLSLIKHLQFGLRINTISSAEGLRDLLFIIDNKINIKYLFVSKVTDSQELVLIKEVFTSASTSCPKIISLIENSSAIIDLDNIARQSDALCFGGADYSLDFGLLDNADNQLHARQSVILYANKYRIPAIDTPTFAVHDLKKLADDCMQSRKLGFAGKLAVSKNQITIINESYQYTPEELSWAQSLCKMQQNSLSIAINDDSMVGLPFYKLANIINNH